jgi:hypothetical protein
VIDEIRQSFVPSRTASAMDVATDSIGAVIVVTLALLGWRTAIDCLTTTLLWIALLGGVAFLALNTLTGVPSGALWLTAPSPPCSSSPAASTSAPPHPTATPITTAPSGTRTK